MHYRQGSVIALCAFALALAGCARPASMDASSQKAFDASLKSAVASAPKSSRKALQADGAYFAKVYFGKAKPPDTLPARQAVQGMTRAEFTGFVAGLRRQLDPPAKSTPKPDPAVNQAFVHTLEFDVKLLDRARTEAQLAGRYTIDQFTWGTPFFQPPAGGDTLDSHATFQVNFTNHTSLDVRPPVIHLTITDPAKGVTLLNQDLVFRPPGTANKSDTSDSRAFNNNQGVWVPPNKPVLLTYTCCDLLTHPTTHATMDALPQDAQFHYSITSIVDYSHDNKLDTKLFGVPQYTELLHDQRCITYLKSRLLTWIPGKERDPCDQPLPPSANDANNVAAD